jgi:hypothetical protein
MPERNDDTAASAAAGTDQSADQSGTDEGQVDWKAKAREWEKRAKQNHARIAELEPKATQFDALEQASKTDLERFQEKLAETTRQATEAQRQALVATVALEKGLPASLARRLQGDTQADLEADADELLAQFPQSDSGPRRPAPDASQGSSATGRSPDQDAANWLQQLVRK